MKEKSLTIEGTKSLVKKENEVKDLLEKDKNTALVKSKKRTKALTTVKSDIEEKKNSSRAAKKTSDKKTTTAKKRTTKTSTVKKDVAKKEVNKKTATKKASTTKTKKATTSKATKVTKVVAREVTISAHANEYFDLPYRYNETVVKLLAQTPTRLFVYWDISDEDRENYIKHFGDDFFYKTVPFLRIINETNNYSFDVEINDFANSWYIDVNDDNCKYSIELYRKFREHELNEDVVKSLKSFNESNFNDGVQKVKDDKFIFVVSSNKIDAPNGKVVSFSNLRTIEFINLKTNEKSYMEIDTTINEFYDTFYKEEFNGEFKGLPTSR